MLRHQYRCRFVTSMPSISLFSGFFTGRHWLLAASVSPPPMPAGGLKADADTPPVTPSRWLSISTPRWLSRHRNTLVGSILLGISRIYWRHFLHRSIRPLIAFAPLATLLNSWSHCHAIDDCLMLMLIVTLPSRHCRLFALLLVNAHYATIAAPSRHIDFQHWCHWRRCHLLRPFTPNHHWPRPNDHPPQQSGPM